MLNLGFVLNLALPPRDIKYSKNNNINQIKWKDSGATIAIYKMQICEKLILITYKRNSRDAMKNRLLRLLT